MRICAIIVTFNRLELLKLSLNKLSTQCCDLETIFVINNASTDGTQEYLSKLNNIKIITYNLKENVGGAGGFNFGMKQAYDLGYDLIWIMDDDTIVEKDTLQNLIKSFEILNIEKTGFICSNVLFKDNTPCLMNIPTVSYVWNKYIENSIIKLKSSSFVSIMFTREAIKAVGLPIKEFFIWGDDTEYTGRITQSGFEGYIIGDSIVKHFMNENIGVNIIKCSKNRIDRYYYEYRNKFYLHKRNGIKSVIKYIYSILNILLRIVWYSPDYKLKRISVVVKGFINGIIFRPKIELVND